MPACHACAGRSVCAAFVNHALGLPSGHFNADNVIVTAGGIQACFVTLALVLEDREDVCLAGLPAYPLYQLQTDYFGATFAALTDVTPEAVRSAFAAQRQEGKRVRAVVLCFPNNPTGAVITPAEARELASTLEDELECEEARGGGFLVLLDEVYLGIENAPHVSMLQHASPRLAQRICLVLSASKGLGAMPGARAAWLTAPDPELITHMSKVQSAATGNASTISQAGLEAALQHCMQDSKALPAVSSYYAERVRLVASHLNELGRAHGIGEVCSVPDGTFYVWADFSKLDTVQTDVEMFERLLELGVAVVPGSAFSMRPEAKLVRFSCAQDDLTELERAMEIVGRALDQCCRAA